MTEPKDQQPRLRRSRAAHAAVALIAVACLLSIDSGASAAPGDAKPYDDKLMRLAEILGAVHYLRELCSANDGQLWREKMKELLDSEGSTAIRRARLTRSFNQGYRSYRRTYVTCTPTAQSSIERFLAEGIQIGDGLTNRSP
ncbi:TIGR02301 family protein [Hyphomicrobium sp. CS1GBMeth3]|uniref:TIGR02301 family protein n=1 Tax=Hyphomicrobium sp. CS1GBMeth3 TaxID=1892845 RepID=UPI000AE997C8|nr:TIGR02301 family protein [Hyphomicrobium sp. CS1GBMeth3]